MMPSGAAQLDSGSNESVDDLLTHLMIDIVVVAGGWLRVMRGASYTIHWLGTAGCQGTESLAVVGGALRDQR